LLAGLAFKEMKKVRRKVTQVNGVLLLLSKVLNIIQHESIHLSLLFNKKKKNERKSVRGGVFQGMYFQLQLLKMRKK